MDSPVRTYPSPGTLDDLLGFELFEATPERCRGRFAVEKRVQQPLGLVHGGAYAAFGESLVSATTHLAVEGDGYFAVGQSNATSFFRPATDGFVHAEATPVHRGRTTWVWDVRFTDDENRLLAASRITLAVRPVPKS